MNQYNEISTLQYMGSKARIISHICDPIMKNKSIQTVVDLFAGTGSVGYALKSYKNVISNDIEYYAYIINQAILNGCNFSELEETSFWAVVEQKYTLLQEKVSTALFAEKIFFVDNVDYKLYQTFCEKTPSVFEPYSDDPRMKELAELVSHVIPGNEPALDFGWVVSSISESAGNSVCFQHFHSIIFRIGLPAIYRSDRFFVS